MSEHWLDVIGVGEGSVSELPPRLRQVLDAADTIVGPPRQLLDLNPQRHRLVEWQAPLTAMIDQILGLRGSPTVILATGDPNWFGIGATLTRYLDAGEFAVHPSPSAFQLAAARLHWPLQNVTTLSLHGRSVSGLHPHILPGNRVLALTSDKQTLRHAADLLVARGYGSSAMTVLENMGGPNERVTTRIARELDEDRYGDFHTLAIGCVADAGAPILPKVPGLPDEAFISDGQLTKRDVRATTLARLAPFPGALLWDVGAGCGSVGIEFMRAAPRSHAICFEREGERLQMIALNREALGVPGLEIVPGDAPQSLEGHPPPDAVFLGGDVGNDALFEACWRALKPGGRLVANAVTIEGEVALFARHRQFGGELVRHEVSVLDRVGGYRALRPRMAVTQWLAIKGTHS
ncbi:MAG TPA: precorrin-6y C5,15-methyltransferase (decarboxylating) subunit CbiE [Devosiaceae bacterium]